MAASSEEKKAKKYARLGPAYVYQPVAIETSGAVGPRSKSFLRELGRRLHKETGEPNSSSYLLHAETVRGCATGQCCCHPGVCLPQLTLYSHSLFIYFIVLLSIIIIINNYL